jgi:hypothetical protein
MAATILKKDDWQFAEDKNFIPDGIVDEGQWKTVSPKLLFILKEPNDRDDYINWDLREFCARGACFNDKKTNALREVDTTWPLLTRWTHGILHRFPCWKDSEPQPGFFLSHENRAPLLQSIAAINLKKSGGGSSTDPGSLITRVHEQRDLLRGQIEEIHPDLIVCCGTGHELWNVLYAGELPANDLTANGTQFARHPKLNWTAISYYHPQARYPHNFLYTMLIDAVKELRPLAKPE